jgi:ribose-phosphate pyrophosphokinase
MLATAGSLTEAIVAIKKKGARQIYAAISHPLLCGPAVDRLKKVDQLKELVVTDTIPVPKENLMVNIKVLSIAPLLADAILRIHNEESVSILFRSPSSGRKKRDNQEEDEEYFKLG